MPTKQAPTTDEKHNLRSAVGYAPFFGWLAAVGILIIDKRPETRWNALQSLVFTAVFWGAWMVLEFSFVFKFLIPLLMAGKIIADLALLTFAYQGQKTRIPVVSDWTDNLQKKL